MSPQPRIDRNYKVQCKVQKVYVGAEDIYYVARRWNVTLNSYIGGEFVVRHSEI